MESEREYEVCGADRDHHDDDGGESDPAVGVAGERERAPRVVVLGDPEDAPAQIDKEVLLMSRSRPRYLADELDSGVQQEATEKVEDPDELVDQRCTAAMKTPLSSNATMMPTSRNALLELTRYGEPGHDEDEHEQVVDGQRVLGEPAAVELAGVLRAGG
jgi:hypothetical protein